MSRLTTLTSAAVTVAAMLGCAASGALGPSIETPAKPSPRAIDELTVEERRALLDRAQIVVPVETAKLDLLAGPQGEGALAPNEQVSCTFAYPDEPLNGVTPKFECAVGPKDIVKVKYGKDNGEVYAEVAASRLFWALGFLADRMYPVRVTCLQCPENPDRVSTDEWRLGRPGNLKTVVVDPATIERKYDAEEIEVPKFEGWSWAELDAVADNEIGAPRAHVDAFKLLAAFIQHVDSKPDNQALVCPENAIARDAQGNQTCERPFLMVKDLGSSFAAAHKFTALPFPKMELESWHSAPVWRDAKSCRANLTASTKGTLEHPQISEAGRSFLAERLSRLSDKQLRDLFTASRVEQRKEQWNGREVTVDDWVRVFKEKRDQIADHRCPT
jgi:hypothetical protein